MNKFKFESKIYLLLNNRWLKILAVSVLKLFKRRYLFIRMDTNNFCNLACSMCPFSISKNQKREIMPLQLFGRVANELFPLARYLYLSCGTEPLVTPDFEKYIEIAKGYKVPFISFCTNGVLMDEAMSKKVIELGVNEVIFSIDGATKATFERIRKGADFDKVIGNIGTLARLKVESRSKLPSIRINTTMQKDNFNELEDILRLAKKYGAGTVQFRHLVPVGGLVTKAQSLFGMKEEYNSKLESLVELAKQLKISITYPPKFELKKEAKEKQEKSECAFPWFYMYINHLGRAKPCPFFRENMIDFHSQTYKDYQNNPKLRAAKMALLSGAKDSCVRFCQSQGGTVDVNAENYFE